MQRAICLLTSSIRILRNTTTTGPITAASFSDNIKFTVGADPRYIAVSDLDGDGKSDLEVVNERSNCTTAGRCGGAFPDGYEGISESGER